MKALIATAALTLAAVNAAGQSFTIITGGGPSGTSSAGGLTSDGHRVAGSSDIGAFIWSTSGQRVDYGQGAEMPPLNNARTISGNGAHAAGEWFTTTVSPGHAYRWSGPGTFHDIGILPDYYRSEVKGVSNSGVVVGNSWTQDGIQSRGFRWTPEGGLVPMPFTRPGHHLNSAAAISRDGSTIVGSSFGGTQDAYLWREGTGLTVLPTLIPSGIDAEGRAYGVNHSGGIIVGWSRAPTIGYGVQPHAVIWRDGGVIDVGVPSGYIRSYLTGVNDLGTVAIGSLQPAQGPEVPAIWTSSRGLERFTDFLAANSVSVPAGLSTYQLTGISADGRSFIATGIYNADLRGFHITVPSPGIAWIVCMSLVPRRRRR